MTGLDVAPRQLGAHYRDVKQRLWGSPPVFSRLREVEAERDAAVAEAAHLRTEIRRLRGEIGALRAKMQRAPAAGRPTVAAIKRAVAEAFSVTVADLESDVRAHNIARPRQVGMYLAQRLTTRSLAEIGRYFGNRDHTTALHAINITQSRRDKNVDLDDTLNALELKLTSIS